LPEGGGPRRGRAAVRHREVRLADGRDRAAPRRARRDARAARGGGGDGDRADPRRAAGRRGRRRGAGGGRGQAGGGLMEPPRLPRHRRRAGGYADGPPGPMLRQRRRVVRGRIPPGAVPSAFTLGNLLSGFFSLVYASQGNLDFAAWLIVVAGLFDLLDGRVARIAGSTSAFGVELDSLCDVVSFGAAPSFLIYQFGLNQIGLFGLLIASLPVPCGAVRLARFNTHAEVREKRDYSVGLPIPPQAGMIVA